MTKVAPLISYGKLSLLTFQVIVGTGGVGQYPLGIMGSQRPIGRLCHSSICLLRLPSLPTENGLSHSLEFKPIGHRLLHRGGRNGLLQLQGTYLLTLTYLLFLVYLVIEFTCI